MKVFVDHMEIRRRYSTELHNFDTVLSIKEKIARYLGIPVNQQTLFFNGVCLLYDDLNVTQCNIVENSFLELYVSSWMDNNSQTEQQSPAPSNSSQQTIHGLDLPEMARLLEFQDFFWLCTKSHLLRQLEQYDPAASNSTQQGQDLLEMVKLLELYGSCWSYTYSKLLRQLEPSNLPQQITYSQDLPTMVRNNQVLRQSPVPSNLPQQLIQGQDLPAMVRSNNNQVLRQSTVPSNSTQQITHGQDLPVMVRSNNNQVPEFSDSVLDKFLGTQDFPSSGSSSNNTKQTEKSPFKLTVMVIPFEETRRIPVEVNAGDNVKELRNELAKIQARGELNLPQNGYIFLHKQNVLDEDKSFRWNLVASGDTIEILGGSIGRR